MSKNTTTATANLFTVDFINRQILGSKKAITEASKGTGVAYKELSRLMKEHQTFAVAVKTQESHLNGRAKFSYKGLNDDFMKAYIKISANASKDKEEFDRAKKFAKDNKKKEYTFMKTWFINKYGENDADGKLDKAGNPIKHFDMEKAFAEIKASNLDEVSKNKIISIAEKTTAVANAELNVGD